MRTNPAVTAILLASSAVALCTASSYAQTSTTSPLTTPPAASAPTAMQSAPVVHSAPMVPAGRIDSQGDGAIPALPLDVQNIGGVSFINGGIGDEEVSELKAKEKDFNVHILLSAPNGAFVSDVSLTLLNSKGTTLLSVADAGPYFYAHVSPGSYTLVATDPKGEEKKLKFTATASSDYKQQIAFKGEEGGIVTAHQATAKIE